MPSMRMRKSAQCLSLYQKIRMMSFSIAEPLIAQGLSCRISERQSSA